ncbi:hypothetical protein [Ramlibacter albus]|uniref:Uncharacterized protein n=1 Tax=Ramlibacter albus TaxID=2079448 RepID=A0A923S1G2_9BURK|nr:hypothetical protein [Ramlibacter albus]MBC5764255.1 hypothetical protein [Ramlibacter albus]
MEKVWGPVDGFYITAYAIPVADGERFCSYAKVCVERPDSYWDANPLFKLFAGEDHDTEVAALAYARLAAEAQIERIPSRERALLGFAMFNESHEVVFPLARQIARRAATV